MATILRWNYLLYMYFCTTIEVPISAPPLVYGRGGILLPRRYYDVPAHNKSSDDKNDNDGNCKSATFFGHYITSIGDITLEWPIIQ